MLNGTRGIVFKVLCWVVEQRTPPRSGGRKGGSLVALANESDHLPLAADTFAVKTEFGSPRVDPNSYGSTLFTAFKGSSFTGGPGPHPFKGSCSRGSPFGGAPIPTVAAGHAEAGTVKDDHGAGPGIAAALKMMPPIGGDSLNTRSSHCIWWSCTAMTASCIQAELLCQLSERSS